MDVESAGRYGNVEEMKQDLMYLKENLWAKHKVIICSSCSEKNSLEVNNCNKCEKTLDKEKDLFYRTGWPVFCSSPDRTGFFSERLSPLRNGFLTPEIKYMLLLLLRKNRYLLVSCDGRFLLY